jgi:hypothetical protein
MAKTVVGLFDTFEEAQHAMQDLVENGFQAHDISMVTNDASEEHAAYLKKDQDRLPEETAGLGALAGTIFGGVGGIMAGIGALTIPGIGPVVAAGSFLTLLGTTALGAGVGAAAGGLIGALVGQGIPEEDANFYAEGIRRGGTLVAVSTNDEQFSRAQKILNQHNAVNIEERAGEWRKAGWTKFDPDADPYTAEEVTRMRRTAYTRE